MLGAVTSERRAPGAVELLRENSALASSLSVLLAETVQEFQSHKI
jgi:hypothetical protein